MANFWEAAPLVEDEPRAEEWWKAAPLVEDAKDKPPAESWWEAAPLVEEKAAPPSEGKASAGPEFNISTAQIPVAYGLQDESFARDIATAAEREGLDASGQIQAVLEASAKPMLELPRAESRQEDTTIAKAGKAAYNTIAGFVEGSTSHEGIGMLVNPAAGVMGMGAMVPGLMERVRSADQTPPNSPERWQAVTDVLGLVALPVIAHATTRAISKSKAKGGEIADATQETTAAEGIGEVRDELRSSEREREAGQSGDAQSDRARGSDEAVSEETLGAETQRFGPESAVLIEQDSGELAGGAEQRSTAGQLAEQTRSNAGGSVTGSSAAPRTLKTFAELPDDIVQQAKGGDPIASQEPEATSFPQREVRPHVGQETPLRQSGEVTKTSDAAPSPQIEPIEHLKPDPEISRLLESESAQTGPQMRFAPSTQGGALGFGGGRRAVTKPIGTTPRGDTEFLIVPSAAKRILHGLEREGAADVLGRTKNKVGQLLAKAMRRHVDTEQELFGHIYTTLQKPIQGQPRRALRAAFDELVPYIAAKENGRPVPAISPLAQQILKAWEDVADFTGKLAQAHNVQVYDAATGSHRPMRLIGRGYIPRMLRDDVQAAMADPQRHSALWNQLVNDYSVSRGVLPNDAAQILRAEAGRFQTNDFMGNLEMARRAQLPESFYDYDLRNLAARYIPSFSERMAQIIAYGQRLGPRDNPTRPNLWDVARKEAGDEYTQQYLRQAEDQSANLREQRTASRNIARLQTLGSGLLLSSPTTTVLRNIGSGLWSTAELIGVRHSATAFLRGVVHPSARKMSAREIGAVRENLADFLHADKLGDSLMDDVVRTVTDKMLKFSGYQGSEVFVRSHAALTASQFARDAVQAINAKVNSRQSKEALALFQRLGVDADAIVKEGGNWRNGPETRKFIRTVIRESQGGYRFDQVPLWANSNIGRFFYQFGRWGTQRARNIWRNGIQPILGERVHFRGRDMVRWDPMPLLKMTAGTLALGEAFGLAASLLFDRDRRDPTLSEIAEAWDDDEAKAVGLALERGLTDIMMAGTLGIWSQPIDFLKGVQGQSRLRNPAEPPGMASGKAVLELGLRLADQGSLTRRDFLEVGRSLAPGAMQLRDVALNVVNDPLYEAENDLRTLRAAGNRWAKEIGLDVRAPTRGSGFRKSPRAPVYEPIKEALLRGDADTARVLAREFILSEPKSMQARQSLVSSIKQSQPFRVGPYTSQEYAAHFYAWAFRNLPADDLNQVVRVQRRYQLTASAAGLWSTGR